MQIVIGRKQIMELVGVKNAKMLEQWVKRYKMPVRRLPSGRVFVLVPELEAWIVAYSDMYRAAMEASPDWEVVCNDQMAAALKMEVQPKAQIKTPKLKPKRRKYNRSRVGGRAVGRAVGRADDAREETAGKAK